MRGRVGMTIVSSVLMLARSLAGGQSAAVDTSSFSLIQVPWQDIHSQTYPTWISDAGDVVGWYDADLVVRSHGFVKIRPCAQGQDPKLTSICGKVFTIDGPGPDYVQTMLLGIDAFGNILGRYYDGGYHIALWYPQCTAEKCSLDFHVFDDPNTPTDGSTEGTYPIAISRDGTITGIYYPVPGEFGTHAFVAHPDRSNGRVYPEVTKLTFSDIDVSGFTTTYPEAISPNGLIAGTVSTAPTLGGFLRRQDGSLTVADVQDVYGAAITGVNSFGMVVGSTSLPDYGFISTPDGTLTNLGGLLAPTGINDRGIVVGNAYSQAFIRAPDGTVTYLNAPGTTPSPIQGTAVESINNAGWITGYIWGGSSATQPFVWKPL